MQYQWLCHHRSKHVNLRNFVTTEVLGTSSLEECPQGKHGYLKLSCILCGRIGPAWPTGKYKQRHYRSAIARVIGWRMWAMWSISRPGVCTGLGLTLEEGHLRSQGPAAYPDTYISNSTPNLLPDLQGQGTPNRMQMQSLHSPSQDLPTWASASPIKVANILLANIFRPWLSEQTNSKSRSTVGN